MNREIYALQLIDEETGEVLKDVTPITESRSVIHNGEKLNEVLDLQRDKIEEQSKSNLVLVTTMQKLLSEKIEELERKTFNQKVQPSNCLITNITGKVINSDKHQGQSYGDYYYLKGPCSGSYEMLNGTLNKWEAHPKVGDTIYTHYWIFAEQDEDWTPRLVYNSNDWVNALGDKKIKKGLNHFVFKHELKNVDMLASFMIIKTEGDIKIYNEVMVVNEEGYFDYVESRTQIDYQEELDFYKSQLEKLKLTQEVDLNLLLTL